MTGDVLRYWREQRGLSQAAMGALFAKPLSPVYLSRLERGEVSISTEMQMRINEAMDAYERGRANPELSPPLVGDVVNFTRWVERYPHGAFEPGTLAMVTSVEEDGTIYALPVLSSEAIQNALREWDGCVQWAPGGCNDGGADDRPQAWFWRDCALAFFAGHPAAVHVRKALTGE